MAPRSATRYSHSLAALRAAGDIVNYVHPDYLYHKQDWDLIRDTLAGERRVKEMGPLYLPPLGKDSGATYNDYKDRAVFVNMVGRTVNGLVGTVFRRAAKVLGVDRDTLEDFKTVTPDGSSLNLFAKLVAYEVFSVGRVGILVDRDERGINPPYMSMYLAENILSWQVEVRDGKQVPTYILLREVVENQNFLVNGEAIDQNGSPIMSARYRVLRLDGNGQYVQEVYEPVYLGPYKGYEMPIKPTKTLRPTRNGAPLDFIPFLVLGPNSSTLPIQRSPIIDIATLNIAHYRVSAQLEHGRFFTALPVYYVSKAPGATEQAEYVVGPSVVWETAPGERPGIIEFFGTGLNSLATSMIEKEEAISQLGGRIMGIRSAATSESEIIFKLKQANEMSILINVTESMGDGFTKLVKWRLWWENDDQADDVRVVFNQDFKSLNIGARELRALAVLYQSNILPIDEVYRVLQETEFISDEVTLEEFKEMLDDPEQFPNQPDVAAMREGYPDALTKVTTETQLEMQENELGAQKELTDRQGKIAKDAQLNQQRADKQQQERAHQQSQEAARQTQRFEAAQAEKNRKAAAKKPAAKPAAKAK